jgi:hypothetical protein
LSGCSINQLPDIYSEFNNQEVPHQDYWTGRDRNGQCIIYGLDSNYENILLENDADNKDKNKIDAQTKYLNNYLSKYTNEYQSKGKLYQQVYRMCNKNAKASKLDTFTNLRTNAAEKTKTYYSNFIARYKKVVNKSSVSRDALFDLFKHFKTLFKSRMEFYQKKEKQIVSEIENFKFYLVENDKAKVKIVEKYNEKFRSLLELEKVGLEKNADIPSLDQLLNKLNHEKYNQYLKMQTDMNEEMLELSRENFNVEYNLKLTRLSTIYTAQEKWNNVMNYLNKQVSNQSETTVKVEDIDDIAKLLAHGLDL